jgi:flavin reductase (DIM6/NTAB) family NADH-FMN oxidoreductase RutF
MDLQRQLRHRLAAIAFGPGELSQFCNLGLRDPQANIKVWLVGMGAPLDVTRRNVLAATRPLVLGIGLEDCKDLSTISRSRLGLEFREEGSAQTLLGKISLEFVETLRLDGTELLCLFRTHGAANYCRPRSLLWRRYLHFAYRQWRNEQRPNPPEIRMVASELHALFVFYICPRPVVLVSVVEREAGNIFPMDLIGQIGRHKYSIALHTTSRVLPLIERSRRLALSNVPVEKIALAYRLGKNHHATSIEWASLPFSLTTSSAFILPVPEFALRIRELEVMESRAMGSHVFFICLLANEYSVADGLQFFQAHGLYEEWGKQAIPVPSIR